MHPPFGFIGRGSRFGTSNVAAAAAAFVACLHVGGCQNYGLPGSMRIIGMVKGSGVYYIGQVINGHAS